MSVNTWITRRKFIEKSALGIAGLSLAGTSAARGANPSDMVGIGIIGVGTKGHRHLKEVLKIPGVKVRGICDLYTGHTERALKIAGDPNLKTYKDYRRLLEDKDIDAVIIATPDFWHAKMTIDAADAGKDIYVEKCMSRTIPEAKAMVKAVKENKRILQLGHQGRSNPLHRKAKELVESGAIGKVCVVRITMYRNSTIGGWRFYSDYSNAVTPSDADEKHIDWKRFLGDLPYKPFSERRFFHWRCYWDYGTGLAGDLLSHKYDDANLICSLGIPGTCVASGGIHYWKDDREVPDVLHALYEYPDKGISITFGTMFVNQYYGETIQIMGKDGTIDIGRNGLRMFLESYTEENKAILKKLADERKAKGEKFVRPTDIPVYTYTTDKSEYPKSRQAMHMENFVDCIRTRQKPRCSEDEGLEEAVTSVMSVIAFKEKRQVAWDKSKQEVV